MKPFRTEKVSSELRQIVSDAIRHHLQDPRISPLTSVSRVEVSRDLEWANVYISIVGDAADYNKTMAGLRSATGFIQKVVAKSLHARQCPHLSFHLDESISKGNEVMRMIEASMQERARDAAVRTRRTEAGEPPEGGTGA